MKHHAIHLDDAHSHYEGRGMSYNEPILPPHWTEETDDTYAVGFDLLGCDERDIHFYLNKDERHLNVTARLPGTEADTEFLWTFSLPETADLEHAKMRARNGVYFISFPRAH